MLCLKTEGDFFNVIENINPPKLREPKHSIISVRENYNIGNGWEMASLIQIVVNS